MNDRGRLWTGVGAWLLSGCVLLQGPERRSPSTEQVTPTPQRLARGRYLAENLCGCLYCHSEHDWSRYTGPLKEGTAGAGGVCLTEAHGVPGEVCTQNLTPDDETGLGRWTDGEIMRAVREGVSRDGRALFPVMPYQAYAHLSDEDTRAIVVYLRSLPARHSPHPPTRIRFPVNLLLRTGPRPLTGPVPVPPATDAVTRGKYLAQVGACDHCHTPQVRGERLEGKDFAGGFALKGPWGEVVSANLTPDRETGLGEVSREAFIGRFQSFRDFDVSTPALPGGATVMPWQQLAGLTDGDLSDLYAYLRSLPSISHPVERFPGRSATRAP